MSAAAEEARKKVEERLEADKKRQEEIRAELDAVPLKDRIKKVIKKVTGNAKGGAIKMACGGKVHMATGGMPKAKKGRRGDGICSRGRTKGRMV